MRVEITPIDIMQAPCTYDAAAAFRVSVRGITLRTIACATHLNKRERLTEAYGAARRYVEGVEAGLELRAGELDTTRDMITTIAALINAGAARELTTAKIGALFSETMEGAAENRQAAQLAALEARRGAAKTGAAA